MEEQHLEEIARKNIAMWWEAEGTSVLLLDAVKAAIREALSFQEEELAFMKEAVEAACKDRDYYDQQEKAAESRYQEEYRIVDRVWKATHGERNCRSWRRISSAAKPPVNSSAI